ncbi:hypothetical protein [Streptosporangium sp. NPDC001681]|uniref:hypothetical protein n=1 Tax=Streptosporangium sp. NPDC001681 TaxID=3154395 RepID=UPI0033273470
MTMDSSTSLSPSSTTPSTGIFAPGRTSSRSPSRTSAVGTSTGSPSRMTTALGGARSSRARMASLAPPRARISKSCAEECEKHTKHSHCAICAQACRACEQACRELLATLG